MTSSTGIVCSAAYGPVLQALHGAVQNDHEVHDTKMQSHLCALHTVLLCQCAHRATAHLLLCASALCVAASLCTFVTLHAGSHACCQHAC